MSGMATSSGYGQYCPIAVTAEIVAERWTPLVLRALCMGATRYSEIRESVPRMSTALLARRLDELERAQIITREKAASGHGHVYRLTPAGEALFPVLEQMGVWAQQWLRHEITRPENLNPYLLMWEIRRHVRTTQGLQEDRKVVYFRLDGVTASKRQYWLVFESDDIDICTRDPGFDVDLWVSGHIRHVVEVWLGHTGLDTALEDGRLRLDGTTAERSRFRNWFALSHFATAGRPEFES